MSEESTKYLDPQQVVFLPKWARYTILSLLGILAFAACISAVVFLFFPEYRENVTPALSVAQTAAGGFAVILFVLFAEKQISTSRWHEKTQRVLEGQITDGLKRIEIPQIQQNQTVVVQVIARESSVYGGRKDIYGANYILSLQKFKMQMWVGINVKRLSVIYFAKVESSDDVEKLKEIFQFTFGGAEKAGYHTNFEYAVIDDEHVVSIWSTALAEQGILGHPAEQLYWSQDVAMMTQSVARTAHRHGVNLCTKTNPGPL